MSKNFEQSDFLFGSNAVFVEELYQLYLTNPESVDPSWQNFFKNIGDSSLVRFPSWAKETPKVVLPTEKKVEQKQLTSKTETENTLRARFMINAYRQRGHYLAKLDPLGIERLKTKSELRLNIEDFGFDLSQLNEVIEINNEFFGLSRCSIQELVDLLDQTYGSTIGAEFNHVEDFTEQEWLFDKLENGNLKPNLSKEQKKQNLQDLIEVEGFENYLHTKFPGAKRFSIEGGDATIVAIDRAVEFAAQHGTSDIVIGMAHRGRLCTLTKVMNKPYRAVMSEFMGMSAFPSDLDVAGDVKYHMGYSSDKIVGNNKIHLSLTPNPSHLEAVNPVVAGKVRAKQDFIKDSSRKKVIGILIHGDAAFCGQGVVAESLSMSGLVPYNVGGILHFVINNQVGFTANANDTRSGRYATEVAKMVGAPILHVNGDDIEAVLLATDIATEYRQRFGKDVVIDVVCYRKYGHNEGDEPMYTQGPMYNIIRNKKSPATIYADQLQREGIITDSDFTNFKEAFKRILDKEYEEAKNYKPHAQWLEGMWTGYTREKNSNKKEVVTGFDKNKLKALGIKLCTIPSSFNLNPKLAKLFEQRVTTLKEDKPIDWATGEQLAFATLLTENTPIRLTGQDCGRGTFSHRHSVLHSQTDASIYVPLNNIDAPANYEVADSNLSEYGVLGFEYGYSLVNPNHLVMWEAQFGDFANGAQIIFDQFISSSETKWLRMSGLVVMLPHGFEGQGPEHSSARLERFLQLAAEDNIQVANPTTPASLFHLLRRQIHRDFRKPLIIMTPKSLLRHKLAVSSLEELDTNTKFLPLINEINRDITSEAVKRVVVCSGKVYYDLLEIREQEKIKDIAILRLEQLYPFAEELISQLLSKYNKATSFIWCQEEPMNMGAWNFIKPKLDQVLDKLNRKERFEYIGRPEAASPAVGYLYVHNKQQEKLVKQALNIGE